MNARTATDSKGQKWLLHVDYHAIKRLRRDCNEDVCAVFTSDLLTRLNFDYPLALELGWNLVKHQAEEAKIDFETWVERWDPEHIQALIDAIVEAITLFFPPARREMLRAGLELLRAGLREALEAMRSKPGSGNAQELPDLTQNIPSFESLSPPPTPAS